MTFAIVALAYLALGVLVLFGHAVLAPFDEPRVWAVVCGWPLYLFVEAVILCWRAALWAFARED